LFGGALVVQDHRSQDVRRHQYFGGISVRLRVIAGLTVILLLVSAVSWLAGLRLTPLIGAALAISYAGLTVYLAWGRVRVS
jgi:Ca2+/Na+ antiporter